MSEKKPNSAAKKGSAKTPNNKAASGKVIKPLRRPNTAKSGTKTSNSSAAGKKTAKDSVKNRSNKLTGRLKKGETKGAYTSVKNSRSKNKVFSKASGASPRGGFEHDKNRFRTIWGISLIILGLLIGRAYYLQFANAQFYQDKGD